jgi:hypothetical protein
LPYARGNADDGKTADAPRSGPTKKKSSRKNTQSVPYGKFVLMLTQRRKLKSIMEKIGVVLFYATLYTVIHTIVECSFRFRPVLE